MLAVKNSINRLLASRVDAKITGSFADQKKMITSFIIHNRVDEKQIFLLMKMDVPCYKLVI